MDYECELINFNIILRWANNNIFWRGGCSISHTTKLWVFYQDHFRKFLKEYGGKWPKKPQQLNSTVQFWCREKRELQLEERKRPWESQGMQIGEEMQQHMT